MNRLAACAVVGICVSSFAYGSTGVPMPVSSVDEDCPSTDETTATIKVYADAKVDKECISIDRSDTTVVWEVENPAEVEHLLIFFQPKQGRPKNPRSSGSSAKLKNAWSSSPIGEFKYTVVVIRNDGTARTYDPRLIIRGR